MQVHQSAFRSVLTCARTVYRTEGLVAFYVSYPTTLLMSVPFTAVQFTVYEHVKRTLNPSGTYSPGTHVLAGGFAGAVAAAATTPLDVAKTILQTRGTAGDAELRRVAGVGDVVRDMAKGFCFMLFVALNVEWHLPVSQKIYAGQLFVWLLFYQLRI